MAKFNPGKASMATYRKWSDGYYSGAAMNTKYGNSSFWLDDDTFTKLDKGDAIDPVRLSSYLRAIGNFVKILTGKDDIKVRFSTKGDSYTDGKIVTISGKIDTGNFDSTVGLALHEAAHCLLTDFQLLPAIQNALFSGTASPLNSGNVFTHPVTNQPLGYPDLPLLKSLINIIEDRRIDYYVMKNAPGYYGYYNSLYDEYFRSKDIDKALAANIWCDETVEHYVNHIINFANPKRNLNALKSLRKIWTLIDLKGIGRLKSTADSIKVAIEVMNEILIATYQPPQPGSNQGNGEDEQQGQPGSEGQQEQGQMGDDTNDDMGGSNMNMDVPSQGATSTSSSPTKELSAAQLSRIQKALRDQREFTQGEVKKKNLTAKAVESVHNVLEAGVQLENIDTGNGRKVEVVVVKGWNKALLESEMLNNIYSTWNRDRYNDSCDEGMRLGAILGRKLQTRNEERVLKTTRLGAGKIDRRLVAELGFGNDKIFDQMLVRKTKESYLHISLDASGSMSGTPWNAAIKTAVAIAKACSMVGNIHVTIDARGSAGGPGQRAIVWVVYDSKKNTINQALPILKQLYPGGATPEGLCYAAISKEILKNANGKDAYFINVSDGEPAFSNYGGQHAVQHTKKQVEKFRNAGINILSYFVGSSSRDFKIMYGKDASMIDTNSLRELSKSINELLQVDVTA